MTNGCRTWLVLGLLLASALAAAPAAAEPTAAEQAFAKGRELFRAGKYVEACPLFEQSEQLDPELGTLFNLAQCDEKIGKLASAIAAYREVVAKDNNAKRKAIAAEYAVTLGQRVPKIVIAVVNPPPGLAVTLDGKTAEPNQPIDVDFGDHAVAAHADGMRDFQKSVKIDQENKTTPVPISLEPIASDKPQTPHPPPEERPAAPTPVHSSRKKWGVVTLSIGGAALVGGAVFGVLANGKWSDAKAVCGGTVCPTQPQADQANSLASTARGYGNAATGLAIAGAVGVAIGAYLIVSAPSEHERGIAVSASVSRDMTGPVVFGRF